MLAKMHEYIFIGAKTILSVSINWTGSWPNYLFILGFTLFESAMTTMHNTQCGVYNCL